MSYTLDVADARGVASARGAQIIGETRISHLSHRHATPYLAVQAGPPHRAGQVRTGLLHEGEPLNPGRRGEPNRSHRRHRWPDRARI